MWTRIDTHAICALGLAGVLATAPAAGQDRERTTAPAARPADQAALDEFEARTTQYMEVQRKLGSKLSRPGDEATPEEIDKHERALAALIENARRSARPGDLFTPAVQTLVRRELGRIFGGTQGQQLLASIMDENPMSTKLQVNGRYPDTVPMSTMPPEVLAVLPPLPKELNYRFIGDRLILLDTEAHIVLDYVDKALPRKN